jgi:hypothetical protein
MKLVALGAREVVNWLFAVLAALSRHPGCTILRFKYLMNANLLKDQLHTGGKRRPERCRREAASCGYPN